MTGWWELNIKEIFFFTKYMYVSVQIIGQVDVDKKAELERKKIKM